jgi:ABC-type branched-subunit amino acid transport system ATPase component
VEAGEIVSVIGPNGAGKSTLVKTIFGLLKPRRGRVHFNGTDITGLSPDQIVRKGLCYVPQVDNVFLSLTVHENLEMGAFIRRDDIRPRLEEIYNLFPDLKGRRSTRVSKLSGGQRQMVALGRALMLDPIMLLLDEPSAGLAPMLVDLIFERVREINSRGITILMVEQNARKALEYSHRVYILANGENRLEGSGKELLENEEVGRLYLGR